MRKLIKGGIVAALTGITLAVGTPVFASDIIFDSSANAWQYINNAGKADNSYTGVTNNKHGWWYVKNGKVDFRYNGFANNQHGWWYIENGKVTFKKSEVTQGTVNGQSGWWNVKGSKVIFNESIEPNRHGWWYVNNGKVDFSKTSVEHNEHGWWYIKNGKVDFSYTGVKNNKHGWWYIKNGKVDFSYNGFAQNENGWWYIENGKVTFNKNDVIQGTVNGQSGWWNVKGSKVIFNESVEQNRHGWWYIKNGKVDFSYTGVKSNQHGWWYIKNGKVDFSYNGFAKNENGWWYIENGKVTFKKNGIIRGTVNGETADWNVVNSKVAGKATLIDKEYADMISVFKDNDVNFEGAGELEKAAYIMLYVADSYYDKTGVTTAEGMIQNGYGTCYAFSDLTYKLAKKAGIKNVWLTTPGKNVNHDGIQYGSSHRTVVALIDGMYFDIDSNILSNNLPIIEELDAMGVDTTDFFIPEQISSSYANYLLGKSNSYTSIH